MKNIIKTTALAVLITVAFSNCATIVSKSSYPLLVHTDPKGVNVSITDKKGIEVFKGTSPAIVKLKSGAGFFSKASYQVKLTLNGYGEKVVPLNYKINGWYFGNIILGGIMGMLVIDPATGAMWKPETLDINETLSKTATLSVNTPALKIVEIKDVPEQMKAHLVRLN